MKRESRPPAGIGLDLGRVTEIDAETGGRSILTTSAELEASPDRDWILDQEKARRLRLEVVSDGRSFDVAVMIYGGRQ